MKLNHNRLVRSIAESCYLTGTFNLSSGGTDSNYIDLWMILTLHDELFITAAEVMDTVIDWDFNSVGGCELASQPIADALMLCNDRITKTFLVRKQRKGHGTDKLVEGNIQPSDRALIVEDVASTGRSMIHAINEVLSRGSKVVGAVAVVDRNEGAWERLALKGIELRSLVTLDEIRQYAKSKDHLNR